MTFAYWRKCDLQIHSPRDPNWTGACPLGQGDTLENATKASQAVVDRLREEWADTFIARCQTEGLEAVAITDHHEMVMFPYILRALERRRATDPNFDLWLFPGMELTVSGGRQCLILFDAELSEDWRRQAQGKLGIVYADLNEKLRHGPKVTQLRCGYPDIGSTLDEIENLRGRYIVLPNVSQGNSHTVLVDGSHAEFLRMTYVGGYLDSGQTIETLSPKNKRRLSGQDETWSRREIYPLPTSDSRGADFACLGRNNAWIKLAAPTAEAIRQAFLGHLSRISIEIPKTPSIAVTRVLVSGSSTLDSLDLQLSCEFNAIIGGRGSGKSSFLEYVAFGLGRSCRDAPRAYTNTDRIRSLIDDTLVNRGGRVELTVVQDGAAFTIVRSPKSAHQPEVIYPNGERQTVTLKELRSLFPAVVYSQGELAEIGKQAEAKASLSDLLQFVDPSHKKEDDGFAIELERARAEVKSAIQQVDNLWSDQSELGRLEASRLSLVERAEALEKTLPALSEGDRETISQFDQANDFEAARLQASTHCDRTMESLKALSQEIAYDHNLKNPSGDAAAAVCDAYNATLSTFRSGVEALVTEVVAKRAKLTSAETVWKTAFVQARAARDEVLKKLGAHKTVTSQIISLREELTIVMKSIGDLQAKLHNAGDSSTRLTDALKNLRRISDERTKHVAKLALEIGTVSDGKIKATVDEYGDKSEIRDGLDVVATRTGSQESTRLTMLDQSFARDGVWPTLDQLRTDCLSLLHWCKVGLKKGEERPDTKSLNSVLGDTDRIRGSLVEKLDTTRVQSIACAVPKPQVSLFYCDGSREISFEKASEGQRAAALLFMLLEQQGGPLIIDQPEGDLDNSIISDLTNKLHSAKQRRQLIFASHNANIVVNGSAELVAHLEMDSAGNRSFACAGAIDAQHVCQVITSTMEGGRKAFKDRQDKYGY